MSRFIELHHELVEKISAAFPDYHIARTEAELVAGKFPAIGMFLGVSDFSRETFSYVPTDFYYILCVFDFYDFTDAATLASAQESTFIELENIIRTCDFRLAAEIEPMVSIAIDEGEFITGWTTMIRYNP